MEVADAYAGLNQSAMASYLNRAGPGGGYIADILKRPQDSLILSLDVPNIDALYGDSRGQRMRFNGYVVYPTREDNARPNYQFPLSNASDGLFERMQGAGEKPIFHDPHARYPLIVISHGGGAHALFEVSKAKFFASHGYIVACLNHGDGAVDTRRNDLYGLRPLAIKALIDALLADEDFGPRIDARRIGITGHSWGGLTALASMGARIFNHPQAVTDSRITAGIGLEPSITNNFGGNFRQSFGSGNVALTAIDKPYLNINGTQNTLPLPVLDLVSGTVYSVTLPGQPHVFVGSAWLDAQNWELVFFDAHLKDEPAARALLEAAVSVTGYSADFQDFDKQKIRPRSPLSAVAALGAYPQIPVRMRASSEGVFPQISFPVASGTSGLYYDLQYSSDARDWLTLAADQVAPDAAFLARFELGAGFSWRTLEDPRDADAAAGARLYRVRVSRP